MTLYRTRVDLHDDGPELPLDDIGIPIPIKDVVEAFRNRPPRPPSSGNDGAFFVFLFLVFGFFAIVLYLANLTLETIAAYLGVSPLMALVTVFAASAGVGVFVFILLERIRFLLSSTNLDHEEFYSNPGSASAILGWLAGIATLVGIIYWAWTGIPIQT